MLEVADGGAGGAPQDTINIQGQSAIAACIVAATGAAGTGQRGKAWVLSPATYSITAAVRQDNHITGNATGYTSGKLLVCGCGETNQLTAACKASTPLMLKQAEQTP